MELKQIVDEKQLAEIEAKLKETKTKLEKIVQEYPLTSITVAVGLGYLLARIFRRGR